MSGRPAVPVDLAALHAAARRSARLAAPRVDALDDELAAGRRALAVLAEEGWPRWTVPEAFGGEPTRGLCAPEEVSVRALCALRRAFAYESGMLDVMLVMQGLGSYALALAGDDEQRQHLSFAASGKQVAAFALTEPEAGSDLSNVATRAVRGESGGWRVTGAKTFISNAPIADFFTLLARTSGEPGDRGGLSMFLVTREARGVEVTPFEVMAPHPIGEVRLHDARLPDDAMVGEEGQGLEIALAVLARFRASVAAAAAGFARRALDESIAHLSAREQFGRPLATFQGLRFDLAEMDTRIRASELLVDEAADAVDAGGDATAEVARAKLFATETASWVCDRAVQHLGGRGVRKGELVERLFREVRALRIYEGTSEVQKLILGKELLARARGTL